VMGWLPEQTDSPAVFTGDDGARFSLASASNMLLTHVSAVGIEDVTAHDLRAYALKQLVELGSPGSAEKIAGYIISQGKQSGSGSDDQACEKAELLEKWSQRLQEVVLEGGSTIGDTPLSNSH